MLTFFVLRAVALSGLPTAEQKPGGASASRDHGQPATWPSYYDVVWTERRGWPGAGALGSMPIGSGMTGANVWADNSAVRLLLAHTDSVRRRRHVHHRCRHLRRCRCRCRCG